MSVGFTQFITDFLFYNSIGTLLATNVYVGLEYISDPEHFRENMYNTWTSTLFWTFDKVVSVKMLIDEKILPVFKDNTNSPDKNTINIKLIFSKSGQHCNVGEHSDLFIEKNIDNKTVYVSEKVIEPSLYSTPPFFSFSLHFNGTTYDIYDKLRPFIVIGNELTPSFFVAFMKKYFQVNIPYLTNEVISYEIEFMKSDFSSKKLELNETILFEEEPKIKKRLSIIIPDDLLAQDSDIEEGAIQYLEQSPIRKDSDEKSRDNYDFGNIIHSDNCDNNDDGILSESDNNKKDV